MLHKERFLFGCQQFKCKSWNLIYKIILIKIFNLFYLKVYQRKTINYKNKNITKTIKYKK